MIEAELYNILVLATKTLLILNLPLLLALLLGSVLTSLVQALFGIQNQLIDYSAKTLILLGLLYVFIPLASGQLRQLFQLAYQ